MTCLRIGQDRVRLYGIGLALIGLSQLRFVSSVGHYWDWVDFYVAGAMAGTRALLDPAAHAAWGVAHQVPVTAFAYMPGFAWILAPAATVSIAFGFLVNAVVMSALMVLAVIWVDRWTGGPVDRWTAGYTVIGWAPVTAAIVTGQNSPLGLVLSLIAIDGLSRGDEVRAGLGVAALCYKPTYALPFGVLLLVFRKWKAIGVVAACGVVWYVVSATAAGGDWMWPAAYLHSLSQYVGPDFAYNRFKSVSVPGLLMLAGVPARVAFLIGVALLVAALVRLRSAGVATAACLAGALGVATSGHAWPYDAVMALPAIWWTMSNVAEPWRTRAIVAAYAIAPLWLASHAVHFDVFALVVIVGAAALVFYPISRNTRSAKHQIQFSPGSSD